MVRAAAKNHASVAVITSPEQYPTLREALGSGGFTLAERQGLAATAFAHTASYDVAVASWMGQELTDSGAGTGLPVWAGATWSRAAVLRYGENPHQRAALYRDLDRDAAVRWSGRRAATPRQGDVVQQLRRRGRRAADGVRLRRAGGGDHQARQPVRDRDRGGHRGGASAGARLRSGVGLRRGRSPPTSR